MSELLPCFSCGGSVDWCMCDEEGCHRIRCETCQYEFEHFVDSSPVGDELSSSDWTANERRRTLPIWNTRTTPASPASKPSGEDVDRLRDAQASLVMPLLGGLLDAWDVLSTEVRTGEDMKHVWVHMHGINRAMEDADAHQAIARQRAGGG